VERPASLDEQAPSASVKAHMAARAALFPDVAMMSPITIKLRNATSKAASRRTAPTGHARRQGNRAGYRIPDASSGESLRVRGIARVREQAMAVNVVHKVRNSMWASDRSWWLDEDALRWRDDTSEGSFRFADIGLVQPRAMPNFGQDLRQCVVKTMAGGSQIIGATSYQGFFKQNDMTKTYEPLIRDLARRVAKANPQAKLIAGSTGLWWVWLVSLAMLVVIAGLMAIGMVYGENTRLSNFGPLLVMLLLLPGMWRAISRGRAQTFDPERPPPGLLKAP
jgi:hypothetical protein